MNHPPPFPPPSSPRVRWRNILFCTLLTQRARAFWPAERRYGVSMLWADPLGQLSDSARRIDASVLFRVVLVEVLEEGRTFGLVQRGQAGARQAGVEHVLD